MRRPRRLLLEQLTPRRLLAADLDFAVGFPLGDAFGVRAEAIASDSQGNLYVGGTYSGQVTLDTGNVAPPLISAGDSDALLAKFDSSGQLLWQRSVGGSELDLLGDISVDGDGNVLATGSFRGTADFNPNAGNLPLTSQADSDAFAIKLDSDGNLIWARQFSGTGLDQGDAIEAASDGSVVVSGSFDGQIQLNPSGVALGTAGDLDVFVVKLDSDGQHLWSGSIGGTSADTGGGLVLDNANGVLLAGSFRGTADLNPGAGITNVTSQGDQDLFVVRLTSAGIFDWGRRAGGASDDVAGAIGVDAFGNAVVTGSFQGSASFGSFSLTSSDQSVFGSDIFVTQLDSNGNFNWATRFGNDAAIQERGQGVAVLSGGDVLLTGIEAGTAGDVLIARIQGDGSIDWQLAFRGDDLETGNAIAADENGGISLVGDFFGTTDFDPGSGTSELSSNGEASLFLTRLQDRRLGDVVWLDSNANGLQDMGESGAAGVQIELFQSTDATVGNGDDVSIGTTTTDSHGRYAFDNLAAGNYYLSVTLPADREFTFSLAGDTHRDSDVDPQTGLTGIVSLDGIAGNTTIDAGLLVPNPHPWQNPDNPLNVDDDPNNIVAPVDVLIIINALNSTGARDLPVPVTANDFPPPYLDVSGDDKLAPNDALIVINFLNGSSPGSSGEGEPLTPLPALDWSPAGFAQCFGTPEHDDFFAEYDE